MSCDAYIGAHLRIPDQMHKYLSRAPLPMSFSALLALIAKSYTLVKHEDDEVTDSKNTFATLEEMTRTHSNQSLDT